MRIEARGGGRNGSGRGAAANRDNIRSGAGDDNNGNVHPPTFSAPAGNIRGTA